MVRQNEEGLIKMGMLVHTQVNLRGRRRGHFGDTLMEKCNQMNRKNVLTFLNASLTVVRHVVL